jgi:ACS family hexuronate transporter-like MFS transporter
MKPAGANQRVIAGLRWYICGLLFLATTIGYVDRLVMAQLKPVIMGQFRWSEADYGAMVGAFQLGYALMMPLAGRLIDWLGTRLGYALAVLVWSLACMAHSIAGASFEFIAARFALGLGEASNFPAAIKTIADWFPRSERALATGLFNSGANFGAMLTPLLVAYCAGTSLGWRSTFLVTGGFGLAWIAVWMVLFRPPREHHHLSAAERAHIEAGQDETAAAVEREVPYLSLLKRRSAWAFIIGKLMSDPVWWFYMSWLPGYLNQTYHLDLTHMGPPLIIIYSCSFVGSIGGGGISLRLINRGMNPSRARQCALLLCGGAVLPLIAMPALRDHLWLTFALLGLSTAAHQGWSANLFTVVSDTHPAAVVGSVTGLGGAIGAAASALASPLIGYWLDFSHKAYFPLFFIAGVAYLVAFCIMYLLAPRLEQEPL